MMTATKPEHNAEIRWLHLTDLHIGAEREKWLWPSMRTQLRGDLEKRHGEVGPWDLVFFTGDLAFKGQEYGEVENVLDEIWGWLAKLGSTPRLLAVPGNHDLQRPSATKSTVEKLERWRNDENVANAFWDGADDRELAAEVENAFAEYSQWWARDKRRPSTVEDDRALLPGDFSYTFEKNGFRLGICGLNSAFLQLTGKEDYAGRLVLDLRQFRAVCDGDVPRWAEGHHACVLLSHHPPSWLLPGSREDLTSEVELNFNLHLCGHQHEPEVSRCLFGGEDDAPVRWVGRSLFGLEKNEKPRDGRYGYACGVLQQTTAKTGVLRFLPRARHFVSGARWTMNIDTNAADLPNDRWTKDFKLKWPGHPLRPSGHPFDRCPSCLRAALGRLEDAWLRDLAQRAFTAGFCAALEDRDHIVEGVKRLARIAVDEPPSASRAKALKALLGCVVPFYVPGHLVESARRNLGIDPWDKRTYRGGKIEISTDSDDDLLGDAIIRSAIFDTPVPLDASETTAAGEPWWELFIDAVNVPPTATSATERLRYVREKIIQICDVEGDDLAKAMDVLLTHVRMGEPLRLLCDPDVLAVLEGLLEEGCPGIEERQLRHLLLLLSKCRDEERDGMSLLTEPLGELIDSLS